MGARVTLRDPLSATRMRRPARYTGCQGLVSFDLDTFLQMAAQSRKWTCPICKASGPPGLLREDSYLGAIVSVLEVCVLPSFQSCPQHTSQILVKVGRRGKRVLRCKNALPFVSQAEGLSEVTEVEVEPDGKWRARNSGE